MAPPPTGGLIRRAWIWPGHCSLSRLAPGGSFLSDFENFMERAGTARVLLIGWDAADWEHINPMLERGELPALQSLIDGGVHGNIATLQPILSPMLWNSVATGKQPWKHGVHGFVEPDPHSGGARPFSSHSRKVKALWNILTQRGLHTNVINWWASHPAEPVNGCIVSNLFGGTRMDARGTLKVPTGAVHPCGRAESLAANKVFPGELSGEELRPFVPRGGEIDQNEDNRLSQLASCVAEMVTTHAVSTAVMEEEPWDFMAVYFTAIDHFSHTFMQYHPPRLPWIPEKDFELYKDVIRGAYRFSDMTLHRMLQLAGPDTTVILCSDHGFQSKEMRPVTVPNEPAGPAFWHRRFGIFVAKGPGIKKGERVYGASLLDIAPTILARFGLPAGADMDGRVLAEIFESPPVTGLIPSWDSEPGNSGMLGAEVLPANPEESEELLRQFVALGYIDAPGESKEEQSEMAEIESKYNLARNLNWCSRHDDALPLLIELVGRKPWESRFIAQLARCCVAAGNTVMARRILRAAYDPENSPDPLPGLILADVLAAEGERDEACALMSKLEQRIWQPAALNQMARHYLRFRRYDDAERIFHAALRAHGDNAEAWEGLSSVYCRRGLNQETADAALRATGLVYRLPKAHMNLGIALIRSGDSENAALALRTAVKFDPDLFLAHRWLMVVCRHFLKDEEATAYHRREARRILELNHWRKPHRSPTAQMEWELPAFPSEAERTTILAEKRPPPDNPAIRSGKCFTLVSGLPRSGTSLMMQMLEAGGMPPQTDGERTADLDNPKGYYEWEDIKKIQRRPEIMKEPGLEKKAIKVISMLLPHLPYQHEYRVLFMHRPVEEVAASKTAMICHRATEGGALQRRELESTLREHRDQVLEWLRNHPRARCLEIDYPSLTADPAAFVPQIAAFLGPELLPCPERMLGVVDPALYRNRAVAKT
jgi:predicted AlkP superfamily phosphohydrolase/phosphomutase/tetratricopeptide (TPR) repeat protein